MTCGQCSGGGAEGALYPHTLSCVPLPAMLQRRERGSEKEERRGEERRMEVELGNNAFPREKALDMEHV